MEELKERLCSISIRNLKQEDKQIVLDILECLNRKGLSISSCNRILELTKKVLPLVVILK